MDLYADAIRLTLASGCEVEAFVHIGEVDRPKCLLLHGNPGCLQDWEHMVPRLSAVADIAAIDLPGFGKAARVDSSAESLSLDRLAQHALSVADALGWRQPFFIVGHSHGGGVAQAVAAQYPDRVAGLMLIATLGARAHASYRLLSLPGAAPLARIVGRMFRSARLRTVKRAVLRRVMSDIFSPERVPSERLDRELAALNSRPEILLSMVHVTLGRPCARLFDFAPDIRCPTLFFHGREDALVPARLARSLHERILNAGGRSHFHLVHRAGHMLVDFQAPKIVEVISHHLLGGSA